MAGVDETMGVSDVEEVHEIYDTIISMRAAGEVRL